MPQREDLEHIIALFREEKDPFRRAKLLKEYHTEKDIKITELSEVLQLKPSYICHLLRLNKIPPIVVDGYYSHLITVSHLFIISRLKTEEQIDKAYEEILSRSLTILQTEDMVREILHSVKSEGVYMTEDEKKTIIQSISEGDPHISVKLIQTRIKQKLVIEIKGNVKDTSLKLKTLTEKMK